MKECAKCHVVKPINQFPFRNKQTGTLLSYCIDCERIRMRQYNNPIRRLKYLERNRYLVRKWRIENPEQYIRNVHNRRVKIKASGKSYTPQEWISLCQKFDNLCLCCGKRLPITVDHIVPISKGGGNTIDNIQPLCKTCNNKKFTKIIDYRVSPPLILG